MARITAKGHEFSTLDVKFSFSRRAAQFSQNIMNSLRKLGLKENDIDIPSEPNAMKKAPASASWYLDGFFLYYGYDSCGKYVENLYVVSKIIELEVNALLNERITAEEFINEFSEDPNVEDKRKKAREVLGLSHDAKDMEEINKKYKELAKAHHPDMPEGSTEKFKEINEAHKTLKRELR